jgi:solute carrier family 25 (mitochondrial 2-oxodicarboxylate transporter), member 21
MRELGHQIHQLQLILYCKINVVQDHTTDVMYRLAIGFCSGTLASVANIPFDVAKSRIQGPQPQPGVVKYRSTLATMATVYREEG